MLLPSIYGPLVSLTSTLVSPIQERCKRFLRVGSFPDSADAAPHASFAVRRPNNARTRPSSNYLTSKMADRRRYYGNGYGYYGNGSQRKGSIVASSGAWAGSVTRGFISETKLATELEQRPTERPMPLQHAAANSRLQL